MLVLLNMIAVTLPTSLVSKSFRSVLNVPVLIFTDYFKFFFKKKNMHPFKPTKVWADYPDLVFLAQKYNTSEVKEHFLGTNFIFNILLESSVYTYSLYLQI